MDHLQAAYQQWLDANPGEEAKVAWLGLSRWARRKGLQTKDASALVLKLAGRYPECTPAAQPQSNGESR